MTKIEEEGEKWVNTNKIYKMNPFVCDFVDQITHAPKTVYDIDDPMLYKNWNWKGWVPTGASQAWGPQHCAQLNPESTPLQMYLPKY